MLRAVASFALLPLLAPPAPADVRLPSLFGEHMVLQRESEVAVWGWAAPLEQVRVRGTWSDEDESLVRAGRDGTWRTSVRTGAAGGPYSLIVQGANRIEIGDVLLGEVWIASGQSNMEWPLAATADAEAAIAAARHPRLRLFTVAKAVAREPASDVAGAWRVCEPESARDFSAVAYHFGRELAAALDVPVGMIHTSWGGTPAEAWTSRATLERFFPELAPALERLRAARGASEPPLVERRAAWWSAIAERDPGLSSGWARAGAAGPQEEGWTSVVLPATFDDLAWSDFDGCVWFRRVVELPASWAGSGLSLELGPADDLDRAYFNGELVGETSADGRWQEPRRYDVPGALVRAGRNDLAVQVVDTGGQGSLGVAGDVRPPLRIVRSDGEELDLAGEWSARRGASLDELGAAPRDWLHAGYPSVLHNGMIAPLVPFGLRGAIWYQGESNVGRHEQYRRLFAGLIADWRASWGRGDFPFHFVQIAPYRYDGDIGQAALLREAQALTLAQPHVGMAVTMDIGDPDDIHPRNKLDVGRRLAALALARDYGRDVPCGGPTAGALLVVGGRARLELRGVGGGLETTDGGPPGPFQIAGADRVFHPAQARIEHARVEVWSAEVPRPVAVRYAWGAADTPNLRNAEGFPAPSFRTDRW